MLGYPDRLHQSCKGIMVHLLDLVKAKLSTAERHSIDAALAATPFFPGLKLPSDELGGKWATATETRELFACATVCLLGAWENDAVLGILDSMMGEPWQQNLCLDGFLC